MNLNNIDLNKIRVFHVVVRRGNYQLAGEELGLTRSAISQSIAILEAQLGSSLFQRKGRRLFPTKEAKALSNEFASYQKSLNEMLQRVAEDQKKVAGLIRVGSYYEYAKRQLIPKVKDFCEQHPQAQFQFSFDSPSRLQGHLEEGRIDLCFSIFPHRKRREIESKPVFNQEMVLIAPIKYAAKAMLLENLAELPIIEYYKSHFLLPRWVEFHFGAKRFHVKPHIYAASAEILLEFVKLGVGVGVLPKYLLTGQDCEMIKIIRPTKQKLTDSIWLTQFIGQFENTAHKKFYQSFTQIPSGRRSFNETINTK